MYLYEVLCKHPGAQLSGLDRVRWLGAVLRLPLCNHLCRRHCLAEWECAGSSVGRSFVPLFVKVYISAGFDASHPVLHDGISVVHNW